MGPTSQAEPKRVPARRSATKPERTKRPDFRQPLWAPEGQALDLVPEEVRQVMQQILRPFYERFVVNATDGLEQSLAITLVHLMWLEALEQYETKRLYTEVDMPLGLPGNYAARINQQLRLLDGKVKVGYLLAYLRRCVEHGGQSIMPLEPPSPGASVLVEAEDEPGKLLAYEVKAAAVRQRRRARRPTTKTLAPEETMDVEAVAEHLTNAEWYEIRENLIGLLKRAYDQADEEERQAAALSRAAATDCQPQTP